VTGLIPIFDQMSVKRYFNDCMIVLYDEREGSSDGLACSDKQLTEIRQRKSIPRNVTMFPHV
jgi:hypothetical protein